jgi:hypothetical protein
MQRLIHYLAVAALVSTTVSCGKVARAGRGSSFLVIDSLSGITGGPVAGTPTATLVSDVLRDVVTPADQCGPPLPPCQVPFGDSGAAVMHVVMKDAGSAAPTTPTALQDITITQYRVEYFRADGRNTPGVDVPFPFDGFVTSTVTPSGGTIGFSLVRLQAKGETPLVLLRNGSSIVTQFAKVTFYGTDQTGAEVTVSGNIQIDFANFGG